MNIKILQAENSIENVSNSVISALYNAHINGDISLEVDNNNQKVGLIGSITAPAGYGFLVSTLNGAYPKFHVTVNSEYIAFADPNIENVLKTTIGDGTGVSFNDLYAVTNDSLLGFGPNATVHPEITDFREGCLLTGLTSYTVGIPALTGLTVFGFPPNVVNYPGGVFANGTRLTGAVVKNLNNFINRAGSNIWWVDGYYLYDMDNSGNLTRIDTLTLPSSVSFPNGVNKECLCGAKLDELIIPSSCTYITSLSGPYLKKISFESPSSLTTIEANTFWYGSSWSNSIVQLDVANLPLTITTIGNHAFRNCSNVTGVLDLPNLISLGTSAFLGSKITSITNLGNITTIPNSCFRGCTSLTNITLPSTVTTILDTYAFADCKITTFDFSNITTVGEEAFTNCKLLATITNTSNITIINVRAFDGCSALSGTINLPSLTSLGNNAFFNCSNLATVTSLGSITAIPATCFYNCGNLTSVVLPTSCISIGQGAFANDLNLTTINLANITSIGGDGLSKTKISTLDMPSLLSIGGDWAFANCKSLTTVSNLGSVTSLPKGTFQNCTVLTSITLPSTCTSIGTSAFEGCINLLLITLSTNLITIDDRAFLGTNITSINIPSSVTTIGMDAFTNSQLSSITFDVNSSLTCLGGGAFNNCKFLSINIPDSCKEIASNCFFSLMTLTSVTIGTGILLMTHPFTKPNGGNYNNPFVLIMKSTTPPTFTLSGREDVAPSVIYVPSSAVDDYKNAGGAWATYSNLILADPNN